MKKLKKILPFLMVMLLMLGMTACGTGEQDAEQEDAADLTGKSLMVYCGAGMKEPFQEIASAFQEKKMCIRDRPGEAMDPVRLPQQGRYFRDYGRGCE